MDANNPSPTPADPAQEDLFHVSHHPHVAGDIKPAGTYWKALVASGHSLAHDPLGEFLREQVRAASYPSLPTRELSSFAFETHADAVFFRDGFRPGATIYKVRFIDPSAPRHRVTWSAFNIASGAPPIGQAHDFWSGRLLYSSNVEVFALTDLEFL